MKTIQQHISERLQLSKNRINNKYEYFPKTKEELNDIIEDITNNHISDKIIDLNMIDTSKITDMGALFYRSKYNYNINEWDVSHVKYFADIFMHSKFDKDISKWKTKIKDKSQYTYLDDYKDVPDYLLP